MREGRNERPVPELEQWVMVTLPDLRVVQSLPASADAVAATKIAATIRSLTIVVSYSRDHGMWPEEIGAQAIPAALDSIPSAVNS